MQAEIDRVETYTINAARKPEFEIGENLRADGGVMVIQIRLAAQKVV